MRKIDKADIEAIEDPKAKEIILMLVEEFDRINNLPPVTTNTENIAVVVNKITGHL